MSRRKQSNPKPLKLDEPWAEGEEGENAQRTNDGSKAEESDRPNDSSDSGDTHAKNETTSECHDDEEMSPKGASDEQGADDDRNSENTSTKMESGTSTSDNPVLPKSRKSTNGESHNSTQQPVPKDKGNMERREKRSGSIRSRGSNVGDSSELEASETEEADERRIPSRRDQDCGSSSRSRTPDRPGSDFGGSPGPFTSHQQQQFLQAGIPYLHLLPAHIRNDAARLFLMPQMLPPELAAAAAAAAATATSNQSPSPGGSGGVNSNVSASQTVMPSSSAGGAGKSEKTSSGENSRSGAMYVCEPCNIKFSSARTLEAHQTYYCSFRKDLGREGVRIEGEDVKPELMMQPSGSGSSSKNKRDRENSDEHEMTMDESMESIDSFSGNQSKNLKTGKLYSCIFCSYSADKKVSLNRHMRMHSGLSISNQMPNANSKDEQGHLSAASIAAGTPGARPVTPGKSSSASSSLKNLPESVSAMERYCQDCDIQFSSIKTFRVHKQYYCSTRHVLKAQHASVAAAVAASIGGSPVPSAALGKAPVELGPGVTVTPVGKSSASVTSACSPIPGEGSPVSTPGPLSSQPFVMLPTNPVIVVPYCFIQGASFLPGSVLPSHNAIIVLPNGTVQSLPGSANAVGGIPIPVPSPSPQSMLLGSHMMMHSPFPTSATPGPSNMGNHSGLMSPNNLAFPDPKEMMKLMSSSSGQKSSRGEDDMISSNKLQKSGARNSGRSSRSSDENSSHHHDHHNRASHSQSNEVCDDSMPAIDLTFRGIQPKKELTSGGDEEKENREVCAASRNSRNVSHDSISGGHEDGSSSRSATPATSVVPVASTSSAHNNTTQDRESVSPMEKMSAGSGSGGKRTPRPSSTSVSSSCSTPPALCEPKLNGMMSHIMSPGGKEQHDLNNKMVMMMLNAGAAAAAAAAALEGNGSNGSSTRGGKAIKGSAAADYNSVLEMTRSRASSTGEGKISPVATQLPGGAILTSASNQSLAELLMTNPPELNESLAKLNPQLLMNAHRASGSPVGFNFNLNPAFMQALSPEIAMRLLDPAYLTSLQQSIQQQQQQQQASAQTAQTAQGPIKRGVSKCIECDIVFYKYENYLVHKEHYCAARTNPNAGVGGSSSSSTNFPPSKTPPSKLQHGKNMNIRDNGNHRSSSVGKDGCRMSSCSSPSKSEIGDDECISPPPPVHRKGSLTNMRKSPDSVGQSLLLSKGKTKSPQNAIGSPVNISPAPSPSGSHHSNSSSRDHGKGGNCNANNQYPCSICGVKFSSIDNLQTHQFYYCNKRKASGSCDNNSGGDNEYSGESKNGSSNGNNGDALIMGLPTNALHDKDVVTGRNKSPGPGSGCRNGFTRCEKCKLAIPEDQMSTHIRVCLGTASPSFGNGSRVGESGGIGVGAPVGWKCPCCDVYSPTVSAAQKHLETHTGIRAFKCLLCGYRGNTLRGMRTHIRTHFDRRVCDLLEGDYMTCITANDVDPPAPANNNSNVTHANAQISLNVTSPPLHPDQIHRAMPSPTALAAAVNRSTGALSGNEMAGGAKSNNNGGKHSRYSPEASKSVNQSSNSRGNPAVIRASCSPSPPPNALNDEASSDVKIFQSPSEMMMMTMMTENDSNTSAENNNQLHYCNLCNYSSPYKGSILKHMKLVHKVPLDFSTAEEAAALMMMQGDHEGLATMSMMMNRGEMSERMIIDDVNGTSRDSSRNSTPKSTLDYAMSQGFSIAAGKSLSPAVAASLSETCSTRARRTANAVVPNGTSSGIYIKEERSESEGDCGERKCSSQSSAEDDNINGSSVMAPASKSASSVSSSDKQQQSSITGSSSSSSASGNYCKSCDISFNYVSSFNAHKKFYCSSHVSSDSEPQERAETPVQ